MARRQAFTLIELLVVISIIALLIGILLPALSHARHISKESLCLSQLRQVGLGQQAYAVDHNDYYTPGYTTDDRSNLAEWSWYRGLKKYLDANEMLWDCPIAEPRYPEYAYMQEIVPGFDELTWADINYGMPIYAYAKNGNEVDSVGGAMGLSFEEGLWYGTPSSGRDMSPCRAERVRIPEAFAMVGDNNNIGINTRRASDVRRVGFHGCYYYQCQNSAHGNVPPGEEQDPGDLATNQWVFADGHVEKRTYKQAVETKGRMFRRDGGLTYTPFGG